MRAALNATVPRPQPWVFWDTQNCTNNPCSASELGHGVPTRNNPAGMARGYTATPPLGLSACPVGGCPPNWLGADEARLLGYDREFIDLVFGSMLSLPYMFTSFGTYAEMRLALLRGFCDVAITASAVEEAFCDGPPNVTVAADSYDYAYSDYAAGLPPFASSDDFPSSETLGNLVSCLEYGALYITTGFAIMSLADTKPFDISSSVFNTDVLNAFSVIIILNMAAGYTAHALERRSLHLGTVSRGAYWSVMNFLWAAGACMHPAAVSTRSPMRRPKLCAVCRRSLAPAGCTCLCQRTTQSRRKGAR